MRGKPQAEQKHRLKTLERVFSKAGMGLRSDSADISIGAGKVRVNGKIVQNPDQWVDLTATASLFEGKPLRSVAGWRTSCCTSRRGILTCPMAIPDNRPTVYNLTNDAGVWLSPVGRLDLDTSGLLLMTNDTAFAERITNPAHEIAKTYQVKAATLLTDDQA